MEQAYDFKWIDYHASLPDGQGPGQDRMGSVASNARGRLPASCG